MNHSPYNPLDKLARSWSLLRRHPRPILSCTVIIVAILYARISLDALAQGNSNNLLILGSELLCEIGPDFTQSAKLHAAMVEKYATCMDQRNIVRLLSLFSDKFSTTKGLEAVSTALDQNGVAPKDIAKTIWQAGDDILIFRMSVPGSDRTGIIWDESIEVSTELLDEAKVVVGQSKTALQQVENDPDILQNYIILCQANRKSILFLSLARSACDSQKDLFNDFRDVVEKAGEYSKKQADKLPEGNPERELQLIIAKSEQRRLHVLEAIKAKKMEQACDILWQEIEAAYLARPKIMELYSKLNLTEKPAH